MHTDTDHLKTIATEIAEKQSPHIINESKADHRLLYETNKLEKGITQALRLIDNFAQRDTLHNDVLGKLVEICDILYVPGRRVTPDTQAVLDLIRDIRKIIPGITSPLLALPKAFIHEQSDIIKDQWQAFQNILNRNEIDKELILISAIPFRRFIDGKDKLYWGDFTWLKGYAAKLDAANWEHADCNSPTEALMSLLIGRDFNHDQFFIYCKKYIANRVKPFTTKSRQLQEYALCQKLVIEDTQTGLPSFDRHGNAVSPRLLKWIKEETDAVRNATAFEEAPLKVEFNWDSDTTAVFYKYLMDKGVTKKVDTKTYAKQIAATISTVGKDEVQWDTFHKRFYSKDERYLSKIFEPLNSILEDIKFFLRKENT